MTESKVTNKKLPIIVVADNIRSLYNVGSLFRLADGLHCEALYLCGMSGYPRVENDPRPEWVAARADKEIRKTGLSGVDAVDFQYFPSTFEAVTGLRAAGYTIVALELTETSVDCRSFDYNYPLAVIVGHETEGVNDQLLAMVDGVVHLPMRGAGKSLNVATATAAFLYWLSLESEL